MSPDVTLCLLRLFGNILRKLVQIAVFFDSINEFDVTHIYT